MKDFINQSIANTNPLVAKIYNQLLYEILSGVYPKGSHLREASLADLFNVSRTPIREVIRQLEREGLARNIKNKGTFVVGISKEEGLIIRKCRNSLGILALENTINNMNFEERTSLSNVYKLIKYYMRIKDSLKLISLLQSYLHIIYKGCNSNQLYNTLVKFSLYLQYLYPASILTPPELKAINDIVSSLQEAIDENNTEKALHLLEQLYDIIPF